MREDLMNLKIVLEKLENLDQSDPELDELLDIARRIIALLESVKE